jgi:hypothetical protein
MPALGRMTGPFSRRGPAECDRCEREVEATWPWPGWGALRKGWLVWIFILLATSPLYLADMHGMMPAAIAMVVAIGPLDSLAAIEPTCLDCGAAVRPRAALDASRA